MFETKPVQFRFGGMAVEVLVPDAAQAAEYFQERPLAERADGFWTRVWPSALAICEYLSRHVELVRGKTVWEIGAGLALPSLFCAQWANHVYSTDISVDAVNSIKQSVRHNGIKNMEAAVWDIAAGATACPADLVIMSDINYAQHLHAPLLSLLMSALYNHQTILLATPDRVAGRDFLNTLLPYCIHRETQDQEAEGTRIGIFLFSYFKD